MPRIAEVSGVAIYVYDGDHPPPHFHARYQGHAVAIEIDSLKVLAGSIPPARQSDVVRWAHDSQAMLWAAWNECHEDD